MSAIQAILPAAGAASHPLRCGPSLDSDDFEIVRREMVLKHCKWDPQVSDISTLAPFPLLIGREAWETLGELSRRLTEELFAAERELLDRPELHRRLGIPRTLRRVLADARTRGLTPAATRVMRFDFHWTPDGWRISEVNSDVPGGFSEASELPRLMSDRLDGFDVVGDPARAWSDAISQAACGRPVGLLSAPGFMEDQQVICYLAGVLEARGIESQRARPEELRWAEGAAQLGWMACGALVRFYQSEWLSDLPRRTGWEQLLAGGRTPVSNPVTGAFGESKRFPLIWDDLRTPLPTWRALLPKTCDPRDAPWWTDESWLLKTTWCNTGDTVTARQWCTPKQWRAATWSARLWPGGWIAQKRFEPSPVPTPLGEVFPCVGVYTIDGRPAGAYTRVASRPVIDFRAIDVALLTPRSRDDS